MAPAPSAAAGTANSHPVTMAATTASSFFMSFSCALASLHVRLNAATISAHRAGRRRVAANTRVDCEHGALVGAGRLALEQHMAEHRLRGGIGYAKGRGAERAKAQGQTVAATSLTEASPPRLRLPFRLDSLQPSKARGERTLRPT